LADAAVFQGMFRPQPQTFGLWAGEKLQEPVQK
jgi:hypothetical protein